MERQVMDRRRLEEAFMQYMILKICSWYPQDIPFNEVQLHGHLDKSLNKYAPIFHKAFSKNYAGS